MKAIRGAITVNENSAIAIGEATRTLLREIAERNQLALDEIVSIFFSVTPDLNAEFPARTVRGLGWDVPMLDMQEMDVPKALGRCVRVLMHVNRSEPVQHAYLRGARQLRPDLEPEE